MKRPFVSAEQLRHIVEEHPTPFHLYDEAGIRKNARRLNKAFAWNPGFREYFAVKATPNPRILQILQEEGCGVDCATLTELLLAEAVGFSGREMMFSSNMTPFQDFAYAYGLGAILNLDDISDIDYLERLPNIPELVCCRYNPGGDFSLSNEIMDTPGEAKYGFTREQLTTGYRRLMDLGVRKFGLHAFLASNTTNSEYYPVLARLLFETAVELHKETGAEISLINLSGGIGIPYRPHEQPVDIEAVGEGVRQAYAEVLAPAGLENVAIAAELGRYMLGPYGCLVATAIRQKETYKHYIGLDACAANLMRPAMYRAYHHITVAGKEDWPCDHVYDVVGGLCENNDKFAIDRPLPRIELGDLVVIHDTGAHGFSMGYNYNGKLRSAELLLRADGSVELIRRAETPADYFATLELPIRK
ncbi:MAG: diaminopimelate decarboxylase family protein [Limnochordia bacterium]|jgi:diaminopimelate decarboxylase|nr:MAG: diaminopimelate decarboxylase [Peptococcaceae bacterium 1109]